MKFKNILATVATVALSQQAAATVYTYDVTNPSGNHKSGQVTALSTSYDNNTDDFSWSHTISDTATQSSDGFWLVVSGGANPKTHDAEYVIFYGDSDAGIVTAYEYNGLNSSNSYQSTQYIDSFDLDYSYDNAAGEATFSFDLDATDINNLNIASTWVGIEFEELLGYWLHPSVESSFSYASNGELDGFSKGGAGWYDKGNLQTTSVSAPATIGLMALSFAGLVGFRRKRA